MAVISFLFFLGTWLEENWSWGIVGQTWGYQRRTWKIEMCGDPAGGDIPG